MRSSLGLGLSILIPLGLGLSSGLMTESSVKTWYKTLKKPFFTPPNWLFPIAWTFLYISMGVCSHIVSEEVGLYSTPMIWYAIQLALNVSWTPVFFGLKEPGWALLIISGLWASVAKTSLLFFEVSSIAGYGMLPYLVWVSYASALNAAIWYNNPKTKKE
jgi:tryptophan-rich sensory protein